mmetsp:Transcript_37541/g.86692  ORF Transcript_37541/g.86692 Transcript_37541/m.86692 type:complete len:85 (+) Transcript_37541:2302-2556(+)
MNYCVVCSSAVLSGSTGVRMVCFANAFQGQALELEQHWCGESDRVGDPGPFLLPVESMGSNDPEVGPAFSTSVGAQKANSSCMD